VLVDLSARWLGGGPRLPDRCVRHGRPAARRVDLVIRSRPKLSSRRRPLVPGYTAFGRGSLTRLTRTETTSDGAAVRVSEPHPEFVSRLEVGSQAQP
jgi:hypothetical protein